jgi:hypothetical protein
MQLTLCDEFDLFTLSRFIALLERPFKAPTAREILSRPIHREIAPRRFESLPEPDPLPNPIAAGAFEEEPERWDGLS